MHLPGEKREYFLTAEPQKNCTFSKIRLVLRGNFWELTKVCFNFVEAFFFTIIMMLCVSHLAVTGATSYFNRPYFFNCVTSYY